MTRGVRLIARQYKPPEHRISSGDAQGRFGVWAVPFLCVIILIRTIFGAEAGLISAMVLGGAYVIACILFATRYVCFDYRELAKERRRREASETHPRRR
jgi:hypothetical protein